MFDTFVADYADDKIILFLLGDHNTTLSYSSFISMPWLIGLTDDV